MQRWPFSYTQLKYVKKKRKKCSSRVCRKKSCTNEDFTKQNPEEKIKACSVRLRADKCGFKGKILDKMCFNNSNNSDNSTIKKLYFLVELQLK